MCSNGFNWNLSLKCSIPCDLELTSREPESVLSKPSTQGKGFPKHTQSPWNVETQKMLGQCEKGQKNDRDWI
jgi:hypothetical protein